MRSFSCDTVLIWSVARKKEPWIRDCSFFHSPVVCVEKVAQKCSEEADDARNLLIFTGFFWRSDPEFKSLGITWQIWTPMGPDGHVISLFQRVFSKCKSAAQKTKRLKNDIKTAPKPTDPNHTVSLVFWIPSAFVLFIVFWTGTEKY